MNDSTRRRLAVLASLVAVMIGCAVPPSAPGKDSAAPTAASAVPAAPEGVASIIVNAGFESNKPWKLSDVEGWYMYQHAGEKSYDFAIDTAVAHGGKRSLRITNIGVEPYGSIAQDLPGAAFAGKMARFSGWLKTKDANADGVVLFIIADGGTMAAHNFMAGAEVKGTRDWQRHSITLAIPPATSQLRIGVTLQGSGSAWFDDAEIEIVGGR